MKKLIRTIILSILFICNSFAQSYPQMISVEGGTFSMGDEHGKGETDELPVHSVTLKTFKIAKTETTVKQWKVYCEATGHSMPKAPSWGWIDSHPIVNVMKSEAEEYCNWLTQKIGGNWHLPSEAEWEYAARGGNKSIGYTYAGSDELEGVAWFVDNSGGQTQSVGLKKPNELGLFDMSGNAWEWCGSSYSDSYNEIDVRYAFVSLIRGGGCYEAATESRVANRFEGFHNFYYENLGFRVVLSQ